MIRVQGVGLINCRQIQGYGVLKQFDFSQLKPSEFLAALYDLGDNIGEYIYLCENQEDIAKLNASQENAEKNKQTSGRVRWWIHEFDNPRGFAG